VSTSLGARLRDGLTLGDIDLGLRPREVRDVDGVELGDKVFYANAAADTDFSIVALPAGAELYAQLRSPEPAALSFDLDLPEGARLRRHAAGGLSVHRDGSTLAELARPWPGTPDRRRSRPATASAASASSSRSTTTGPVSATPSSSILP
jgi:hypothetical protein